MVWIHNHAYNIWYILNLPSLGKDDQEIIISCFFSSKIHDTIWPGEVMSIISNSYIFSSTFREGTENNCDIRASLINGYSFWFDIYNNKSSKRRVNDGNLIFLDF